MCDGTWEGFPIRHVGAVAGELQFQRFRGRDALKKELSDADLIQVVSGGPSWALSVLGLGRPVALAVASRAVVERRRRETMERGALAMWRRVMTRVTDRLDNRALRSSDAVLVMNPWMLRYATEIAEGRSVWVRYGPPGVDAGFFRPPLDRLPKVDSPGYVLSVGRFDDPRKNVELLLEALAITRQTTATTLCLKLAGPANPGPSFWRRVQELGLTGAVTFHTGVSRDTLVRLYQNALCFALASDEEGFGIVITEAMACGLPVVATRCGGPDGIIRDGVDGYLVPRGNAAELADRLCRLVRDRVANELMGIAARESVEERFSEEKAGEIYLDTYRHLLRGSFPSS